METKVGKNSHKKKEKTSVENYRPVPNLVEVGKFAVYAAAERIIEHFIENNFSHSNHHGGLPNRSTTTALIQLFDLQKLQRKGSYQVYLDCEESDTPQGSVLAKVFLIMNSIDMPDFHKEAESVIFIDDGTDSVSAKKPEDLVEKLQIE